MMDHCGLQGACELRQVVLHNLCMHEVLFICMTQCGHWHASYIDKTLT